MPQPDQQVMLALGRLSDLAISTAATSRERELIIADREIVVHALLRAYESNELVQINLDDVREVLAQHRTDRLDETH